MSEHDHRIRKQWLAMWTLSIAIAIINHFLLLFFSPSPNAFPQAQAWSLVFGLVGIIGFGLISYHCSYRKPGTKLLTFCLLFTAASLLLNPILYLSGKLDLPTYIPYYKTFVLMTQGTGILWIITCWRMRKLNKRLQATSKLPASG